MAFTASARSSAAELKLQCLGFRVWGLGFRVLMQNSVKRATDFSAPATDALDTGNNTFI